MPEPPIGASIVFFTKKFWTDVESDDGRACKG